ncbi:o-succinylbenzoate synthase [Acerihabitans sp. TG2]|uniref:o-succinylbenzoate synthase n=1 Tax=Acerihabitans sp. TG2 TaxID=3096008 RepID=UPI002B224E7B|nr:o-succinylbenzoate synthase [Acerihabitans sp. TG2]MEA9389174.1 o-succinylbenzoate synthase [Acerihabitans sp. TG2]
MRSATLYGYSVPMDAGVVLRNPLLNSRDGLVAVLQHNGRIGMGEIAPLPGFSLETLAEAKAASCGMLDAWVTREPVDRAANQAPLMGLTDGNATPPSVAFGISCALAELAGQLPEMNTWLTVPLCTRDPDMLLPILLGQPGKKQAKMKVGMHDVIHDSQVVNRLLAAVPDLYLRLDANRRWTPDKAAYFAQHLDPSVIRRIDFIEEPCVTPDQSLAFAQNTGIPIAWDESAREPGFQLVAQPGVAALVIKPSLTGSLCLCRSLILQAQRAGLSAVISSAIESSLGLSQLSRLAGWLTPRVLPGLDTLSLMGSQLIRPWPGSRLPLITLDQLAPIATFS